MWRQIASPSAFQLELEMSRSPSTLAVANPGRLRCTSIEGASPGATRVKSLGLCEGRELELLSHGDPMIVHVSGARIGLSRQLAELISVDEPSAGAQER